MKASFMWRKTAALIAGMCLLSVAYAGKFQAGTHYQEVTSGLPSTEPTVIEFFSYGCPHCNSLEPTMENWLKNKPADIKFIRVPVVFRKSWEAYAKAYYIGEALGVLDKSHPIMFHQVHGENKAVTDDKALKKFFEGIGVKGEDFDKVAGSFTIATKMNQASQAMKAYKISSVPSFVINEKYYTSLSMAKSNETLAEILTEVPVETVARFPLQP